MDEIKIGSEVTTPNSKVTKTVKEIKGDQATLYWEDKNDAPHYDTLPVASLTLKKPKEPLSREDLKRLGNRFG